MSLALKAVYNVVLIKVSIRYTRRRSGVAGGPAVAASRGRGPAAATSPAPAASLAAAAPVLKIARIALAPSLVAAAAALRIGRIALGLSLAAAPSDPRTGPSHDRPSVPSPALGPANDPGQDQSHAMGKRNRDPALSLEARKNPDLGRVMRRILDRGLTLRMLGRKSPDPAPGRSLGPDLQVKNVLHLAARKERQRSPAGTRDQSPAPRWRTETETETWKLTATPLPSQMTRTDPLIQQLHFSATIQSSIIGFTGILCDLVSIFFDSMNNKIFTQTCEIYNKSH